MKKLLHFKYKQALLLCLFLISSLSWGQVVYTGNFGVSTGASNSYASNKIITLESQTWLASYSYFATGDFRLGHNKTTATVPIKFLSAGPQGASIEMQWDINNVKSIAITTTGEFGSPQNWFIFESIDQGVTWAEVETSSYTSNGTWSYNAAVSKPSSRYAFVMTGTSSPRVKLGTVTINTEPANQDPSLLTSTTSITDLSYIAGNGPSDLQTFTISGTNLDGSEEIALGLEAMNSDFEVSADGITFGPEVTLPGYDGTGATISVRLKAGRAVATYADIIYISGYSAPDATVTLLGTVTAPPSIPVVTAENLTGTFGQTFSHQVIASDTPDLYSISSGSLPNGITLNTITGLISGTPTQAGIYTADITATNISGTSEEALFNFEIAKATQTLSSFVDLNKYDTDIPFVLPENSDAGIAVVYTSSNSNVATVTGNTVVITGIGATTISATNSGDANWNAFSESITLTVTEAPELYAGIGDFELVTNISDLTDGYYVIANEDSEFIMTNGRSGNATGGYFLSEAITPVGNKITNPIIANVWKIETNGSGKTIYNEVLEKYVGWSSGNAASIEDAPADSNRWTFTYSAGKFTVNNFNSPVRQLSYNLSAERFAAYANAGQQELQLYKLIPRTTWDGTSWSNTVGPDATTAAIIEGNFSTTTDLNAKSLTITSGVFTVSTGTTLTVANAIVNNAGAANFIVENDAVVLQDSNTLNTGAVTVKRNSADLYRQDYTLWSSPVTGQNLRAFSEQTIFSRFYSYSNAVAGPNNLGAYVQELFDNADIAAKNFNVAQGYLIRMPNDWPVYVSDATLGTPYAGSFQGTLNNGDYTFPLVMANTNMNLVGNPYPSPISVSAFIGANANIQGTLYFWRKRNGTAGTGYATSTGLGVVNVDSALNIGDLENLIKPGQGFFVKGVTAGNVLFNNSMRVNTAGGMFLKTASDASTETHRFWLNLSTTTEVVGQTLVGYTTAATQGVDNGIDAVYFNDSALALTSLINDTEYAIQGRSLPFVDTDIVPLGFKSDVAGSFSISLASFDGLFDGDQGIFLKDNSTGALHNLKTNAYLFTTEVGVFNSRFEVYYNSTLSTSNPVFDTDAILIGVKNQQITINAGSMVIDKVELIDVSGRIIYTTAGVNATTAVIDNLAVSNQMLIVRISTSNNKVINQKIIF